MTTLTDVTSKKKPDPSAEESAARELVRLAREQGLSLTGPDGLLKQFTKSVLETALNEEMTEHLGHAKHRAPEDRDSSNIRNGTRAKTVLTEASSPPSSSPTSSRRSGSAPTATLPRSHPRSAGRTWPRAGKSPSRSSP